MGIVLNGAAIRAASTGFKLLFVEGMELVKPAHMGWMDEVISTGSQETYHFPEMLGDMREWVGDRYVEALSRKDYTIKNREWEKTVAIPRSAWEDDNLGGYRAQVKNLGSVAATHPDVLMADLLIDGFTATGYDDVAFFSANHPLKSGVQANLQAGALSETTFNAAMLKLMGMKNFEGKPIDPLGVGGKLTLMVGPANRVTALEILKKQYVDQGETNINFEAADLQVNPRITGNHWFLGVRGGTLRPLILQMRRKPNIVSQDQVKDDEVFTRNRVVFGCDGRWNAGYAFYQLMIGSTGA